MNELIFIEFCMDCLMVTANGVDTPEQEQCAARIADVWGADWILTHALGEDDDGHFGSRPCEGCGTRLAGDRFPAVAMHR